MKRLAVLATIFATLQQGEQEGNNYVEYNSRRYAALDGTLPTEKSVRCQSDYLPLPCGWSLAPDSQDSIVVISRYPWGTHLMVVASGAQYYTQSDDFSGQAGDARTWICCANVRRLRWAKQRPAGLLNTEPMRVQDVF